MPGFSILVNPNAKFPILSCTAGTAPVTNVPPRESAVSLWGDAVRAESAARVQRLSLRGSRGSMGKMGMGKGVSASCWGR